MTLTERIRSIRPHTRADDAPAADQVSDRAAVHISATGELVIDLRHPIIPKNPRATTDMRCTACGGALTVDELDAVAHLATMSCVDCGLTFAHRLPHSI